MAVATKAKRRTVANAEVARLCREVADLLEIEEANPFRVRAYRNAARTVEELPESVQDLLEQGGEERLDELPGIGTDLAGKIAEIVHTGTLSTLEELARTGGRSRPAPRVACRSSWSSGTSGATSRATRAAATAGTRRAAGRPHDLLQGREMDGRAAGRGELAPNPQRGDAGRHRSAGGCVQSLNQGRQP